MKKNRIPRLLTPHAARTQRQLSALQRDNISTPNGWILLDGSGRGTVTIAQQKPGKEAEGFVRLPRHEFARLARWYLKPQRTVTRV